MSAEKCMICVPMYPTFFHIYHILQIFEIFDDLDKALCGNADFQFQVTIYSLRAFVTKLPGI